MALNFVQSEAFYLAGAGTSLGDTTILLQSFTDPLGNLLTMASFGSLGYITIEPGTLGQEESATFTGVTQNADGTATLTGVSHALFVTPYTQTSGLEVVHASGVTLVVTNTSAFYAALVSDLANLVGVITSVGVTTSFGTFSSAQFAAGLTDETGTGVVVFSTTPTLVTPILEAATATSIAVPTLTTLATVSASTNASVNIASGSFNTIQTYTPAGAGTATLDLSKGNVQHITMPAGNIAIAISNGSVGQCFIVRILQDSSGSRTVTWFTTIKWAGGSPPTLTATANKADTFGFEITGSGTYDGFVVGQNI